MKSVIDKTENLRLVQVEITDIVTENLENSSYQRKIVGVKTKLGQIWSCDAAIICGGTFLNGRIFVGDVYYSAGPDGLLESRGRSESLADNGISLMRFKTGTPVRVKRSTIDFSRLERQDGEKDALPFSWKTPKDAFCDIEQEPCYVV